jgi:hypothetical protein
VVDAVIKVQFLYHIAAFVWSARNTHCSGTFDSRDLANDRADRTRSCRDHHGFACGGFADLEQPHVGVMPGMPRTPSAVEIGARVGSTF